MSRTSLRIARKTVPLLLAVCAGCATLANQGQPLVPTKYQTRTGPYVVYTSFQIPADAPAIRQLQSLDNQLSASLGLSIDAEHPIEVYILSDRKAFNHFLMYYYPELPPRRAFFLAQGPRRVVYTFQGERLEEDLRHEATHALLHSALADVPLWLDEGVAEYFEGTDDRGGANLEHLNRLPEDREDGWKPDLVRLEALKDVRQMTPRDYREAWGWVHYLLNGPPAGKAALLAYLQELRASPDAVPLSRRLDTKEAFSSDQLLVHLEQVRSQPIAVSTSARDETVRLQSGPPEPPSAARRKSLFTRLREAMGL